MITRSWILRERFWDGSTCGVYGKHEFTSPIERSINHTRRCVRLRHNLNHTCRRVVCLTHLLLVISCYCRFDIRLRGFLSKHKVDLVGASKVEDFKRTRTFKYVPLQCVTVILGPFGDDFRFLTSSEGFHHPEKTHIVTFEEVARGRVYIGFVGHN